MSKEAMTLALEALKTGVREINMLGGAKEAVPLHEAIAALREALAQQQQGEAVPENCDVRKILLEIVPGDGDGYEVYAKSNSDVETKLGEISSRLEDWELGIRRLPAPAQQHYEEQPDGTVIPVAPDEPARQPS